VQIFDSPPGTSCPVVAAVKRCDYVILVTEPTPFGYNDLKLAVATIRIMGLPMGVVINRDGIGNDEVQEYCNRENIDILARIPYDPAIARLYSEGSILLDEIDYLEPLLYDLIAAIRIKTSRS
jgi:MinD superfamily P-loop ATPase